MSKSIKIVLQEKVDLKKFFKNLKENYNQGPLDYNIQEVILEDKEDFPSSSDPEQADVLANKRLDPKIESKPLLKTLVFMLWALLRSNPFRKRRLRCVSGRNRASTAK